MVQARSSILKTEIYGLRDAESWHLKIGKAKPVPREFEDSFAPLPSIFASALHTKSMILCILKSSLHNHRLNFIESLNLIPGEMITTLRHTQLHNTQYLSVFLWFVTCDCTAARTCSVHRLTEIWALRQTHLSLCQRMIFGHFRLNCSLCLQGSQIQKATWKSHAHVLLPSHLYAAARTSKACVLA